MDVQQFVAEFGYIANAPGGVARLREIILSLATQGKLVPQTEVPADHAEGIRRQIDRYKPGERSSLQRSLSIVNILGQAQSIPSSWMWLRLGEVVDVLDSKRRPVTKSQRKPGPFPYYGASGIVDRISDYIFDESLILVGEDGAKWGRGERTAFVISGKTWVNNHAHVLRSRSHLIKDDYLTYAVNGMDLSLYITGITVPKLNQERLLSIPIPVPPLSEQARIVAKVDELMALCDKLEAQQKARETRKAVLAQALLTRFAEEPSQANLQSLFHSSRAITPADLRKAILTLAPRGQLVEQKEGEGVAEHNSEASFLPEELPYELPDGWGWKKLGDIVVFIGGSQPPKSKFIYEPRDSYTRFIQIRDFKSNANLTFIPTSLANRQFKEDDVMIGRYGPPVFQILRGLSGTYNVALMKADPISKLISKEFLFYLLQEPRIQDRVIADSDRTAGQSGVRKPLLHSFIVAIPPLAEQRRIVAKVDELMALVDKLETQLATANTVGKHLVEAVVSTLTGITTSEEQDLTVKAPPTELIANL